MVEVNNENETIVILDTLKIIRYTQPFGGICWRCMSLLCTKKIIDGDLTEREKNIVIKKGSGTINIRLQIIKLELVLAKEKKRLLSVLVLLKAI